MQTSINSIAFSVYSNKGTYALLLGSGISRTSGIPTGWDIVIDLIKKIAKLEKEDFGTSPEEWYRSKYSEEPDYSNLLEKLASTATERLNILRPYFESTGSDDDSDLKEPTLAHRAIAKLIKTGYIKVVITTNFDRLLETAIRDEQIEPFVIRHSSDIEGAVPLMHSNFTLIKVNGDYLDSRFLNTKTELDNYDSGLDSYVLDIINNYGLITCGWSAKWDNGLINIIRRANAYRYNSYWTCRNEINPELVELANLRKGQVFQIESADTFFTEVTEKIEALESFKDADPVSLDIAIARLKKYISKDEYKIKLHDLLIDATKKVELSIKANDKPSLYPSPENFKPILERYTEEMKSFVPLIVNATIWCAPVHHEYFTDILLRLLKPDDTTNGTYDDSRKFKYFPAIFTLYAIGITAVKKENYALLQKCFTMKFSSDNSAYASKNVIIEKVNPLMIDKKIFNAIIGQNKHTPISTYLNTALRPYFSDMIFTEVEFNDCFDIFEYLLSLNYLFLVGGRYGHDWAPWGEYLWRRRNIYNREDYALDQLNKIAESQKENWNLLQSGMFNSSLSDFTTNQSKLEAFLKDIHLH